MPENPNTLTVDCNDPSSIVGVVNSLMPLHDVDTRNRFNGIKLGVLQSEGVTGVYNRFNGRTVADILATESPHSLGKPIDTGEQDDVKFSLYDPETET
ncbi:hypothetical protein RMSM_05164 [Rhodopirellula maiorica SM1]|uniref:Uncharacterized protein n=1 Tax=Rhodopirellula maiorica SM1 TaxID=1265738 RepID=M5RRA1_9BACT|nr:hypothetical protein [Rhodopirellula maiorica]EMI17912.1 hypothetical protein RMSM_05164 [Rhodopirellula maiorica SM1]